MNAPNFTDIAPLAADDLRAAEPGDEFLFNDFRTPLTVMNRNETDEGHFAINASANGYDYIIYVHAFDSDVRVVRFGTARSESKVFDVDFLAKAPEDEDESDETETDAVDAQADGAESEKVMTDGGSDVDVTDFELTDDERDELDAKTRADGGSSLVDPKGERVEDGVPRSDDCVDPENCPGYAWDEAAEIDTPDYHEDDPAEWPDAVAAETLPCFACFNDAAETCKIALDCDDAALTSPNERARGVCDDCHAEYKQISREETPRERREQEQKYREEQRARRRAFERMVL